MLYSSAGGYQPVNIDVVRGKYIACNHSLLAEHGSEYHGSNACIDTAAGVSFTSLTCQRRNVTSDDWEPQ
jgi:hypothetical protein